ncbi:MAG: AI-2E family transporter [Chitinophagales bacterium]|nr:AI-2E family transporter [Chitinophagales bacterium]
MRINLKLSTTFYMLAIAVMVIAGMVYGKGFFIPFLFGVLLSMLMLPVCAWIEKKGLPRGIGIAASIILIYLVVAAILTLFSFQIANFAEDAPELSNKLMEKFHNVQSFIEEKFGVTANEQTAYIQERLQALGGQASGMATNFLGGLANSFANMAIVTVFIIFFLIYREKFKIFFLQLVSSDNHDQAKAIMYKTSKVTQQYLTGVFTVIIILAILNSVGLLVLGIQHAVFFGVLAAILNIIPYIGVFIGSLLPILMALLTKDSFGPVVGVGLLFMVNQMIENNILTPMITGSRVKINPMATLMVIIIGSEIWGVAGMILFIPLLGITKIVCDHVPQLQPVGFLIGEEGRSDETTVLQRLKAFILRKKKKAA